MGVRGCVAYLRLSCQGPDKSWPSLSRRRRNYFLAPIMKHTWTSGVAIFVFFRVVSLASGGRILCADYLIPLELGFEKCLCHRTKDGGFGLRSLAVESKRHQPKLLICVNTHFVRCLQSVECESCEFTVFDGPTGSLGNSVARSELILKTAGSHSLSTRTLR